MKTKLESIQILRALAVLLVIMVHSINWISKFLGIFPLSFDIVSNIATHGQIGVDLFFVISGFIMIYTTKNKDKGIKEALTFAVNRVSRIFPLSTILISILGVCFITNNFSRLLYAIKVTIKAVLLWWGNQYSGALLSVRWTLSYELYFYAIIFLSMLFLRKRQVLFVIAWAFTMTVLAPLVLGMPISIQFRALYNLNSFKNFIDPIIWEFVFGAVIAANYKRIIKFPNYIGISLLFVLIILYSLILKKVIHTDIINFDFHSLFIGLFMSCLVVAFLISQDVIVKYTPRFFIYTGNISYSLYLVHYFLLNLIFRKGVLSFAIIKKIGVPHVLQFPLFIIMTFVMSHYTHKYIENKLSLYLRNKILAKI